MRRYVTITYALIMVVLLMVSYSSMSIALGAYDSWVNYEPIPINIERIQVTEKSLAKHVMIVLLDGLSVDLLLDLMNKDGEVARITSLGALYVNGLSNTPTYSIPARASILTGSPPEINGVSSNEFRGPLKVDSLVKVAKDLGYKVLCVGDQSIEALFKNVIDEGASIDEGAGHGVLSLVFGYKLFKKYVERGDKVLIWIGIADVDLTGHETGGYSKEYNSTALNYLKITINFMDLLIRDGLGNDTLIVLVNDHGFKRGGHHGGPELEVRRVFLLLVGSMVKPGKYYVEFTHNDIAPTISMIMGWGIPVTSIGKPITEGLNIPLDRVAFYNRIAQEQRVLVIKALSEATGVKGLDYYSVNAYDKLVETLRGESKAYRLALASTTVALALLLVVGLLAFGLGRGSVRGIRARSIAIVVALLILYELLFWTFYFTSKGPLSLSDVESFESFTSTILNSCVVASILTGLVLGSSEITPLRRGARIILIYASTIMALATVLSLAYPVMFYIDYGLIVRFPFPDWNSALLYFLAIVKASFTGLVGLPLALVVAAVLSLTSSLLHIAELKRVT